MNNSTSFNIMNELNESDTNAFKLNRKVIIESDKVVTKDLKEANETATFELDWANEDIANMENDQEKELTLIKNVENTLKTNDINAKVEVISLDGDGFGGWPIVKVTGPKEDLAKNIGLYYLNNNEDEIDYSDIYDTYLENKESKESKKLKEEISARSNYDKLENAIDEGIITKDQIADELMQALSDDDLAYYLSNIFDFENEEDLEESEKSDDTIGTFSIDVSFDTDSKKDLLDKVNEWLGPIADKVKVTVAKFPGYSGWPTIKLTGDKGLIANKLVSSGYGDTVEEVIDTFLEESEKKEATNKIEEAEVKNLQEVKSQGNIYMLKDDNKYMVGENYNESEGILENAEIYESKDEADKDYLSRCDIKKDNKEADLDEGLKDTIDNAVYNIKMKHYQNKQKRLRSKSEKYHKKAYDLSNKVQDAYHKWSDMEDKEIAKEMKNKAAKENK